MEDKVRPERDFKGVWIEREIWLSKELTIMEKVIFAEIHSLDNERGCFASNGYFAKFFDVSERQIGTYIASLKKKGFITATIVNGFERTIRVTGKYAYPNATARRKLRMDVQDLGNRLRYNHRAVENPQRGYAENFMGGMKRSSRGA